MGPSADPSSATSSGSTSRRGNSQTGTASAGRYFAVDPAAFVRTPDLTRQAFSGTWTADNNIRVTWSPTVKQKISGWYAYQRKDDAHWLQQILFMSPERRNWSSGRRI